MGDFVAELGAQVNGPGQALRPSQFVEAIAMAFGLQEEDYQLGEHKIFLRSGAPKYGRPVPLDLVHCPLLPPWPGKAASLEERALTL